MDALVFGDWLEKGLGRAALAIQERDPRLHREAILYACTHNLAFNPDEMDHEEYEYDRASYMMDIIRLTGDLPFHRAEILRALRAGGEEPDLRQLFAMARSLAQDGDEDARSAMYATFRQGASRRDFTGASELILLDGVDALLLVLGHVAPTATDRDGFEVGLWVGDLEERDGTAAALEAVGRAFAAYPGLRPLLWERRDSLEYRLAEATAHPDAGWALPDDETDGNEAFWSVMGCPPTSCDERLSRLVILAQSQKGRARCLSRWGQFASQEDLLEAAEDLLAEEKPGRLLAYLHVFRWRRFPRDHARLLGLARRPDDELAGAAVRALANIAAADVRALALEFGRDPERYADAVYLLAGSHREGDHGIVEALLEKPMGRDHYHRLGTSALHFARSYPSEHVERVLTLLYEHGPCPCCRAQAVKLLIAHDVLPHWMRRECQWDANHRIREVVNRASQAQ